MSDATPPKLASPPSLARRFLKWLAFVVLLSLIGHLFEANFLHQLNLSFVHYVERASPLSLVGDFWHYITTGREVHYLVTWDPNPVRKPVYDPVSGGLGMWFLRSPFAFWYVFRESILQGGWSFFSMVMALAVAIVHVQEEWNSTPDKAKLLLRAPLIGVCSVWFILLILVAFAAVFRALTLEMGTILSGGLGILLENLAKTAREERIHAFVEPWIHRAESKANKAIDG